MVGGCRDQEAVRNPAIRWWNEEPCWDKKADAILLEDVPEDPRDTSIAMTVVRANQSDRGLMCRRVPLLLREFRLLLDDPRV
eukprot:scaffold185824_cov47-Attheya_sp.AAC.6